MSDNDDRENIPQSIRNRTPLRPVKVEVITAEELADRDRCLQERESELRKRSASLETRESELNEREVSLRKREAQVLVDLLEETYQCAL